jgi:hypothetical protein
MGRAAKLALKLGDVCAVHFSNEMIAISQTISDLLKTKYGYAAAHRIPNGVHIPVPATATDYLATLGLEKGRYAIAVGRFVPERVSTTCSMLGRNPARLQARARRRCRPRERLQPWPEKPCG